MNILALIPIYFRGKFSPSLRLDCIRVDIKGISDGILVFEVISVTQHNLFGCVPWNRGAYPYIRTHTETKIS